MNYRIGMYNTSQVFPVKIIEENNNELKLSIASIYIDSFNKFIKKKKTIVLIDDDYNNKEIKFKSVIVSKNIYTINKVTKK